MLNAKPSAKATIKWSVAEKKKPMAEDASQSNKVSGLKATMSARNLFAGKKNILDQITEFCNELKRIAMGTRGRDSDDKLNETESEVGEKMDVLVVNEGLKQISREVDAKEDERRPLLEVCFKKTGGIQKGSVKEKQRRRKKMVDYVENIPISQNLENIKHEKEERLL